MFATRIHAVALSMEASKFFARRRLRQSQAKVRSTTHRRGSTSKLFGGTCPCCDKRFKAAPPAGLEPGSPFGPNPRAFVLYLRFGQVIPYQRLDQLMSDLFGLAISEGALANMLRDSAPAFEAQTSRIRERLLAGTALRLTLQGTPLPLVP